MVKRTLLLSLLAQWLVLFPSALTAQDNSGQPAVTSAPAPDPEFSPRGNYAGPFQLPAIVRYQQLPIRMELEPLFHPPLAIQVLDKRLIPLWERMLREGTDLELVEVAALSLARVAEIGVGDIQMAGPALQTLASTSRDEKVRYAAALALANGNIKSSEMILLKLAQEGTDDQRLRIEPALARWKTAAASELWKSRITDEETTVPAFGLATEGLMALQQSDIAGDLLKITVDTTKNYRKRMAAAKTAAELNPEQSYVAAESLLKDKPQNRLLGLALLNNSKPESATRTAEYCVDESDAVASAAWQQVFRHNSELLTAHLDSGRKHRDSVVRITAARVMRQFATAERAAWLQLLLSDVHIEVRNVARSMLVLVANEHPELKEQIISQASQILKPDSMDWQGMEQSLVLLGQLYAADFSQAAFQLLSHSKDEVAISAAWLIQLYPDEAIRDQVRVEIETIEMKMASGQYGTNDIGLREKMLLQYAGLVRMKEIETILEKQFSKSAPGGADKRCSALWALALLHEKSADATLARKYVERLKERVAIPPEFVSVRRASALSLGLLRAADPETIAALLEAYDMDPQETLIPATARWSLQIVGQPTLPDLPPNQMGVGGWRILPVE